MFGWAKLIQAAKLCLPALVIAVGVFGVFAIVGVAADKGRPSLLWLIIPVVYLSAVVTMTLLM